MTNEEGKELTSSFIEQCEKDNDPYLVVHFSRDDDHYCGLHEGMDMADALLVINQLIKYHKIHPEALEKLLELI